MTLRFMVQILLTVCATGCSAELFAQGVVLDKGQQIQIGRYTTQQSVPEADASNPLEVYARISFPRATVITIGDALRHTLLRTGYSLPQTPEQNVYEYNFLNLPLPESQRTLGPFKVTDILKVLIGSAWDMRQDDVQRLVTLSLSQRYASTFKQAVVPTPAPVPSSADAPVSAAVRLTTEARGAATPAPAAAAYAAQWRINPNDQWLSAAMTRWAKEARVNLNWAMAEDFPITLQQPRIYTGTFTEAVKTALSDVSRDLLVVLSLTGNELTISKKR
jgi:type IV pili sensor histidine kinase/response regulator